MPIGTRPFEFNRLETQGFSNSSTACISKTEWSDGAGEVYYYLTNTPTPTVSDIATGEYFYTTNNNGIDPADLFNGQSEWYGVRTAAATSSVAAVQISTTGEVLDVTVCDFDDGSLLSVSGSIPYVNYYVDYRVDPNDGKARVWGMTIYKTGSQDWNSIEGAVSQSLQSINQNFSASNFNDFISASVSEYFDNNITGTITDASNQISSSIQFQGYPLYNQSTLPSEGTETWNDLGQDAYLIKVNYDTGSNINRSDLDGQSEFVTLTGLAPNTTGNATYDGTHESITDINYVGFGIVDHNDEDRFHIGYQWADGSLTNSNIYIAHGYKSSTYDPDTDADSRHILVNQDELISDFSSTSTFEIEIFGWWLANKRDGAFNVSIELWSGGTWSKVNGGEFSNSGGTKHSTIGPYYLYTTRGNITAYNESDAYKYGDRLLNHPTNQSAYIKLGTLTFTDSSTGNFKRNLLVDGVQF